MVDTNAALAQRWHDVAARVKARIDDAIPKSYFADPKLVPQCPNEAVLNLPAISGVLNARELEITEQNVHVLLPKIADKTYTAVEVTTAFCKRATIAHQVTNCLALILFDSALSRAVELDEYLGTTGKTVGPLHGLPISIKEHIEVKGTVATAGFIAWADDVSKEDALVVKILREAGAVFHVKTTNPQALMALETVSNIYGRTTNPHNRSLNPGGSSGGEGALIAMRGSLLGVGTDMGGSIRCPAAFCGIYGLKPSIARNPHSGLAGNYGGMENIVGVVGPMATCVEDIRIFQEVILAPHPWNYEPSLVRLPWNPDSPDALLPVKLKIGIIWDDSVVQPHPPIMRTLKAAAKALTDARHQLIDWDTSIHREIQKTIEDMFFLDAAQEVIDVFEAGDESPVAIIENAMETFRPKKAFTLGETWKLNSQRNAQQTKYAEMWNTTGIDFILAPANPAAAPAHDEGRWGGYTGVWNALDHSAVTFPVSTVQDSDTYENFPPRSETSLGDMDAYYIDMYKEGPRKFSNAPIALQVIGRRHTEERMLKVVEVVQQIIAGSV
ncbi:hypothetical protein PVAG01_00336 [Phlyctema vagabunda]|uniref:amidase n=1 Tax=Phlyctema vagabunda TaxID=108571 RepID=A0ABR4PTX6_9HELO